MRSIPNLSWAAIALTVSSCATYQHVTLTSDLQENDAHEFVYENDSIIVRYNFNGPNCPVSLYVENKLNRSLYIDWNRSAIVQNNQSRPYRPQDAIIEGTANSSSSSYVNDPTFFSTSSNFHGTISGNESVAFLPPHSYKIEKMLTLESELIPTPSPKKDYAETFSTPTGSTRVYFFDYEKENSPRHYRSFMTLSTNPSFDKTFVLDHEFWVSEITEATLNLSVTSENENKGNQYYLRKSTGAGVFLLVTTFIVFLAAMASQ
jgi:hypothetical protein